MTKSPRKNVSDVGIELGAACMPRGHASNRATAPGLQMLGFYGQGASWRVSETGKLLIITILILLSKRTKNKNKSKMV